MIFDTTRSSRVESLPNISPKIRLPVAITKTLLEQVTASGVAGEQQMFSQNESKDYGIRLFITKS